MKVVRTTSKTCNGFYSMIINNSDISKYCLLWHYHYCSSHLSSIRSYWLAILTLLMCYLFRPIPSVSYEHMAPVYVYCTSICMFLGDSTENHSWKISRFLTHVYLIPVSVSRALWIMADSIIAIHSCGSVVLWHTYPYTYIPNI